jgi:hypothetical protein
MTKKDSPETMSYELLDTHMLKAITIANTYQYAKVYDMAYLFDMMLDSGITRDDIKKLAVILSDGLVDITQKDFDLQYQQSIINNKTIIPPKHLDTVVTFDMLQSAENLDRDKVFDMAFDDTFIGSMVHSLQQTTVNCIKFQLKYGIQTLILLINDELVWEIYPLN